jgi:hypothetical protein
MSNFKTSQTWWRKQYTESLKIICEMGTLENPLDILDILEKDDEGNIPTDDFDCMREQIFAIARGLA